MDYLNDVPDGDAIRSRRTVSNPPAFQTPIFSNIVDDEEDDEKFYKPTVVKRFNVPDTVPFRERKAVSDAPRRVPRIGDITHTPKGEEETELERHKSWASYSTWGSTSFLRDPTDEFTDTSPNISFAITTAREKVGADVAWKIAALAASGREKRAVSDAAYYLKSQLNEAEPRNRSSSDVPRYSGLIKKLTKEQLPTHEVEREHNKSWASYSTWGSTSFLREPDELAEVDPAVVSNGPTSLPSDPYPSQNIPSSLNTSTRPTKFNHQHNHHHHHHHHHHHNQHRHNNYNNQYDYNQSWDQYTPEMMQQYYNMYYMMQQQYPMYDPSMAYPQAQQYANFTNQHQMQHQPQHQTSNTNNNKSSYQHHQQQATQPSSPKNRAQQHQPQQPQHQQHQPQQSQHQQNQQQLDEEDQATPKREPFSFGAFLDAKGVHMKGDDAETRSMKMKYLQEYLDGVDQRYPKRHVRNAQRQLAMLQRRAAQDQTETPNTENGESGAGAG